MEQVETVSKAKAVKVVGQRLLIGVAVGASQYGAEKIDEGRPVSSEDFLAAQNLVPLALTALSIPMTLIPKSNTVRAIGADLCSSASAMMTYRVIKMGVVKLNGMRLASFRRVNRAQGGTPSKSSANNPFGYNTQFN